MQNVSESWKENQKQNFVGESFVEVTLSVSDPDALGDASASDNGHDEISNVEQTVYKDEKSPVKYVTMETNLWILDGTFEDFVSGPPYGDNGYVGNVLSDDDADYKTTIPTITISFSQVFDTLIPGLTITWGTAYGEWADTYRITAYNNSEIVSQKTFSGNTAITSISEMDMQGYNRITIEVLKWCLPHRRARIENIIVGIEKVYSKSELMDYTHSMFVDPLSATLPKSEIIFEIQNLNGEYNPDNPRGAEKYLMERQEITARYGYKIDDEIEWIDAGRFYMSEWDTPQNGITATFTARDVLEYMTDVYEGDFTGTLMDIAQRAIAQANLSDLPGGVPRWVVSDVLSEIQAPEDLELSENTIAEVLQLCANAGCCVFYQDRKGQLHIEPLADGQTDYRIDRFVSYANSEISLSKPLKAVNVNNGQYVLDVGTNGETQPVVNPLISEEQAPVVAQWVADYLTNRKALSGEFRADPRLDALDRVVNENQFAENIVLVTQIQYTYNGAFRGSYEGRAGV